MFRPKLNLAKKTVKRSPKPKEITFNTDRPGLEPYTSHNSAFTNLLLDLQNPNKTEICAYSTVPTFRNCDQGEFPRRSATVTMSYFL